MNTKANFAILVTAKLMLVGSVVMAQSSTPAAAPQPVPPLAADQQPTARSSDEPSHTAPVFWVSSVEVMRSTHAPQLDVVRVRGLTSTEGWESAQLVPLTRGIPPDGILDLALVAEAPEDSSTPTPYPEVEAVFTIETGHPFKGVRVHGAANSLVLRTLPGYAASVVPPRDCADCQGKLFIPKGKSMPAGASATVREEELPRNLRVIRDNEGIGQFASEPNRMTLLLNESGQIVMAVWD